MIPLPKFKGQNVCVLGLGPAGLAAVKALAASGATVFAWDAGEDRDDVPGAEVAPPRLWPVEQCAAVVFADGARGGLSRTVAQRADEAGVPCLTDLDLLAVGLNESGMRDQIQVVAVTGAAGKSVTVSIIGHVLAEQGVPVALGGDVGWPYLALPAPTRGQVYVLEVPVRRLSQARQMRTDVSVVLNIAGARPRDEVELALRSLLKMFCRQGPCDTAIIGVDDPLGQKVCTLLRSGKTDLARMGTLIPVSGEASLGHGVFVLDSMAYSAHTGKTQVLGDFSRAPAFLGAHFNQDAAAAIATCLTLDVPPQMIIKALHNYEGLVGRFECLGTGGGILFVDDSYASSCAAAERAVSACPNVFWIGGDPAARDLLLTGEGAAINGAYLIGGNVEGAAPLGLRDAFERALKDAQAFATATPGNAPVILFAPGVPAGRGGFAIDEFRSLASMHIDREISHA